MDLIRGKWPKYLTNGLDMSENYCDVWEISKNICEIAYIYAKRLMHF